MLSKVGRLVSFAIALAVGFAERWRQKGPYSAWIFVRVRARDFVIRQRNKNPKNTQTECPCCGWKGYDFLSMDSVKFWLPSVFCPQCTSHERQRMLHLYIHRHDPRLFGTTGTGVHFAPEPDVRQLLLKCKDLRYFLADLVPEAVTRFPEPGFLTDIQRLALADNSVDLLFCLHVLEHVRRDRDAIAEFHRVLKPGAVAYIMVPFDMTLDDTVEWEEPDPDIFYHIWAYSIHDFKYRLECFDFQEIKPDTFLTSEERQRYRIPPKEVIYRCVKAHQKDATCAHEVRASSANAS